MIAQGLSKEAMARELNVCPRTVELRRRSVMKKLDVPSYDELVRFAILATNGHEDGNGSKVAQQKPEYALENGQPFCYKFRGLRTTILNSS